MNKKYDIDFETVSPKIAESIIKSIIFGSLDSKDFKTFTNAVRNYVQATGDYKKIKMYIGEYNAGMNA